MNTIKHEGNDYEVLSLDRISEITHAMLAGDVFLAKLYGVKQIIVDGDIYTERMQKHNNIQPLKLLERKPVEFVGVVYSGVGNPYVLAPAGTPSGMKFRCVEVTK